MIMNCMYRGTSILEPLFKDVFIITNDNLYPRNSKIYEKKTRYNERLYSEVLTITEDILHPRN